MRALGIAAKDDDLEEYAIALRALCLRIEELQILLDDEEDSPELDHAEIAMGVGMLISEVDRVRANLNQRLVARDLE